MAKRKSTNPKESRSARIERSIVALHQNIAETHKVLGGISNMIMQLDNRINLFMEIQKRSMPKAEYEEMIESIKVDWQKQAEEAREAQDKADKAAEAQADVDAQEKANKMIKEKKNGG